MNKFSTSLEQSILDDSIFKNGKRYAIRDRVSSFVKNAHRFFDSYLDKLEQAMLMVFCEDDPKFELDKGERQYANIRGIKKHYSGSLREGMATTLAIIGVYNNDLVNCSQVKRERFAYHIVHDVLASASWKRLVTLNHCLSLFAEASPDAFLEMMDKISKDNQLISDLQTEEGDMFSGGFHWSGIVWALETLAWSPEYIARVVKILAQLAEFEQPSNFHPKPTDALAELFIPWFPQTVAEKEKIVATARVFSEQHPWLCWKVLTASLGHMCSSGSPLPKIRQILPTNFKNEPSKDAERFIFLKIEYVKILLDIVTVHREFFLNLIEFLPHLRGPIFFDKAIQILCSCDIQSMTESDKEILWTKLRKLACEHRKHQTAEWAFTEEELKNLDKILPLFTPNCTIYKIKYLFDKSPSDWFSGDNYEEEQKIYEQAQTNAVEKLFQESQFDGVYQLIKIVDCPTWLGMSCKKACIEISCDIIETLLGETNQKISDFLDGYLKQSYYENKEYLISEVDKVNWDTEKKLSLILHLPFCNDVWHLAEDWLEETECLYWQKRVFALENNKNDFSFAIIKALRHRNALLAFDCVAWNNHYGIENDVCLIIRTMQLLITSETFEQADKWLITQIIKDLQSRQLTEPQIQEMQQIEFFFLPLLASHSRDDVSPVFLEKAIATDPVFFHQIICALYKSEKKDWQNPYSIPENIAPNLYLLVEEFDTIPGLIDNQLDYQVFKRWYDAVMSLCKESGHEKMANHTIGKMLRTTPKDNNGLWINRDMAELLNADDNDELRSGFYFSTINARGAHVIDFTGKEDQELAADFKQKAGDLEDCGLFSFAKTLRSIAQSYEREAKENIEEAKKRQDEMTLV